MKSFGPWVEPDESPGSPLASCATWNGSFHLLEPQESSSVKWAEDESPQFVVYNNVNDNRSASLSAS